MCRRRCFKTKSTVPPPAVDFLFFLRLTTIRKVNRPTPPSARGAEMACIFRFPPRDFAYTGGERVQTGGGKRRVFGGKWRVFGGSQWVTGGDGRLVAGRRDAGWGLCGVAAVTRSAVQAVD